MGPEDLRAGRGSRAGAEDGAELPREEEAAAPRCARSAPPAARAARRGPGDTKGGSGGRHRGKSIL